MLIGRNIMLMMLLYAIGVLLRNEDFTISYNTPTTTMTISTVKTTKLFCYLRIKVFNDTVRKTIIK